MAYSNDIQTGQNAIAGLLRVIAWITFIGGFFAGIALANVEIPYTYISGSYTEFSFPLALAYWAGFFVSGTVFLGFAEIIQLLQQLIDKEEINENKIIIGKEGSRFTDLPEL